MFRLQKGYINNLPGILLLDLLGTALCGSSVESEFRQIKRFRRNRESDTKLVTFSKERIEVFKLIVFPDWLPLPLNKGFDRVGDFTYPFR